jgi:putative ABC transport system permease protein
MLRNYLVTALRNLNRHKSFSVINLAGLSVGLAATILIYSFIAHELSYDRFHENHDRIYRINSLIEMAGDHSIKAPVSMGTMSPLLGEAVPGVKRITRVNDLNVEVRHENQRFFDNRMLVVDSSFLEIFTFRITDGNSITPLSHPGTVVFSETLAEKIFGTRNASGRVVNIRGNDYMISAVTEDVPSTSHIRFDILMPFIALDNENEFIQNKGFGFYTYFMLEDEVVPAYALEETRSFIDDFHNQALGGSGIQVTPFFQPLGQIHLYSEDVQFEMDPRGKISNVYIFSLLAAMILVIAIVNHVNLVTARSETRSREVALRKIAGSSRNNLVTQFLSESLLTTVIAMIIAISLVELLVHPFGNLVNREITLNYLGAGNLVFLVLIVLVTGIGAGAYPALILSSFSPLKIFRSDPGSGRAILKVVLVVFQFSIAVFLITCLVVLYYQMHYMQNRPLGFNRDNIIVVDNITPGITRNFNTIKQQLFGDPAVISVTASESIPGRQGTVQNSWHVEKSSDQAIMIYENRVQDQYFETYQIPVIAGRSFREAVESDRSAYIINQAAARALDLEDPVGEDIMVWETRGTIIGVVSDFHFQSLHEPIKPLVHTRYSDRFGYISISSHPAGIERVIELAGRVLSESDPEYVFNYVLLDDLLLRNYESELRNNRLISMAAILSVILSVMGLYSLTSFTILRKTKELGIRKALGADTGSLVFMLFRNTGQWILVANIIGWPVAWYAMSRWLENFAYRTDIQAWMFVLAGLAALMVALLTITGLVIRAVRTNPIEALRYE